MTEFICSINVWSERLSLKELSDALGHPPEVGSYDKRAGRGRILSKNAVWRIESAAGASAPLDSHLSNLFQHAPIERLRSFLQSDANAQAELEVAAIFQDAYCTVSIPHEY